MDKEIVDRVIKGNASKQEARDVADWFSSTSEGQSYLASLINESIFSIESDDLSDHFPTPLQSELIYDEILNRIHRRSIRRNFMRVAAIIIPFIILSGLTFYTNKLVNLFGAPEYTEIYVPKGKTQHIFFQDGSEAYLNADTKIRFPKKFGLTERTISMEGEAYFQIATNSKRPFFVKLNETKVKVHGTEFNVTSYPNEKFTSVVLDTGKISFMTKQETLPLLPGQQIIYDNEAGKWTINSLEKSLEKSAWRNDVVIFKDTPLADVLRVLNRKYDVEFRVENPHLFKFTYTLTTENASISKIMSELEKITPIRAIHKNDKLILIKSK